MGSSFTHTVHAGESPQKIAQKYGTSWSIIRDHPDNAFIKAREQRKAYPIYPGDRLTIPNRDLHSHWDEFVQSSEALMGYLWSLVTQHPSYPQGVKLYSHAPPKAKPVIKQAPAPAKAPTPKAAPSAALEGYKKKHARIWTSVVLTRAIESAFDVLLPYLPASVVMTSGYRSDADQERIINEYYVSKGGDREVTDVEQRRQWLIRKKGMKIARVGSSPHRTGLAFDLSGAGLGAIDAAVALCAKEKGDDFPLHSTIVEKNQNCLHVNLKH
jgi:hypothetical protein